VKGPKKKAVERFRGLALGDDDRRALAVKKAGGRLCARHWRRIRILEINWRFTTADARRVFRYRAGTTPGPKD
jgi:hypothetical protein